MTYLIDDTIRMFLECVQYGRVRIDPLIVLLQTEHDVLAFPQVAVFAARLLVNRRTTDAPVLVLGRQQVLNRVVQYGFKLGILCVSIEHTAGTYGLSPHLSQRKLRSRMRPEEIDELVIRQAPLVPIGDRVLDVAFQMTRQLDGVRWKGNLLVRGLYGGGAVSSTRKHQSC